MQAFPDISFIAADDAEKAAEKERVEPSSEDNDGKQMSDSEQAEDILLDNISMDLGEDDFDEDESQDASLPEESKEKTKAAEQQSKDQEEKRQAENKEEEDEEEDVDFQALRLYYAHIVAGQLSFVTCLEVCSHFHSLGGCMAIGLRFAGTFNSKAAKILLHYVNCFRQIKNK